MIYLPPSLVRLATILKAWKYKPQPRWHQLTCVDTESVREDSPFHPSMVIQLLQEGKEEARTTFVVVILTLPGARPTTLKFEEGTQPTVIVGTVTNLIQAWKNAPVQV